jgi:hypothetical protein
MACGASDSDGVFRPVLLKCGQKQYVDQFAEGLLYMNTLKYFMDAEADEHRSDPHEGTSYLLPWHGAQLSVKVAGEFTLLGEIQGPVRYQPDALQSANVFCMHALRDPAVAAFVDPRNFDLGDALVVVTDYEEFMTRGRAAVPGVGQELRSGLIEYIDETSFVGQVGEFKKDLRFSYQNEFRIALLPGTGKALPFRIGDLSDIVIRGPLCDVNDRLRVQVNGRGFRELQIRN